MGKHSTPIGYIPAGSTNDFASSLGLSLNLQVAASDAVDGFSQSFDIGMFNGHHFAYVAAFGMLAKVSYSAPQDLKNILERVHTIDNKEISDIMESCRLRRSSMKR